MITRRKDGSVSKKDQNLSIIGSALDAISWEWLNDNYPQLAEAI